VIPSLRRRLYGGGAWSFSGRLAGAGLYFLLNVVLVRYLDPEDVGFFFVLLSVATGGALLAQMGVSQAATKLISEVLSLGRSDVLVSLVARVFITCAIGILLVSAFLYLGVGELLFSKLFRHQQLSAFLPLVIVWMATTTLLIVLSETFRGFHDIRASALLGGSQSSGVISIGITILVWVAMREFGVPIDLALLVKSLVVVAVLVILAASFGLVKKVGIAAQSAVSSIGADNRKFRLLPLLPSFFLVSATVYIMQQSDIWIVAASEKPEITAIYGSASRLVFAIGMPLMIVNGVVPPMISELLAKGRSIDLENILRRVTTLATWAAGIGVMIVIIAGEHILTLLFGAFYADGYLVLVILSVGKFVNVMAGSSGLVLLMGGQHRLAMLLGVSTAFLTLITASLIAQEYGSVGVATVFASGLIVHNALMVVAVHKTINIRTYAGWFSLKELRALADSAK